MHINATLIATAANVADARMAAHSIDFACALSASGNAPATHYASSGPASQEAIDAASPHCQVVVTSQHSPIGTITAAGLKVIHKAI